MRALSKSGPDVTIDDIVVEQRASRATREAERSRRGKLGRPKVGLGIYIYSCHAGELFGFVPVARDEQAFSC